MENCLNKIHKRSYEGTNGEVIVVVGTRDVERDGLCGTEDYAEAEFVFKNGKLIEATIGASGTYVEKVPQCPMTSSSKK